ncbi:uncharacterized protein EI97DRAFT_442757 [Westerdykella ornata]|uniref:Uncharacterized protein n=1 Tax=Westerdykella ornata TaxID=318751 RepID=A0A6A6JJ65_WESOR|nr:uncharacterized protein EI97DRAFT_442757 [Westerdykella ornata]KAF2276294.1 hypothetical protein EI97DRAFT_442757 [Westerdykella ornata]
MPPPFQYLSTPPLPDPLNPRACRSRTRNRRSRQTHTHTRRLKCPTCSTSIPLPPPPDCIGAENIAATVPLTSPEPAASPSICSSCLSRFRSPGAESVNRRQDTLTSFPGLFEERGGGGGGSSSSSRSGSGLQDGDAGDGGVGKSWISTSTQISYVGVVRRMFSFGFGFGVARERGRVTSGEAVGEGEGEDGRGIEAVRERRLTASSVGTLGSVVHEDEVGREAGCGR